MALHTIVCVFPAENALLFSDLVFCRPCDKASIIVMFGMDRKSRLFIKKVTTPQNDHKGRLVEKIGELAKSDLMAMSSGIRQILGLS